MLALLYMVFVLEKGLEPLSLATLVPKTSAYTNSATPAMCAQKGSNLRPYP